METEKFLYSSWSPGKLLLTSEYFILDGIPGIAVPLKVGQGLKILRTDSAGIKYEAFDSDGSCWLSFHCDHSFQINQEIFKTLEDEQIEVIKKVKSIFSFLSEQSLVFNKLLEDNHGLLFRSELDFPRSYGFGTSSTFLCNLSKIFNVDVYELGAKFFGGSGYDLAVGLNGEPIIYSSPNNYRIFNEKEKSSLREFGKNIMFVYQNEKANTSKNIEAFKEIGFRNELGDNVDSLFKSLNQTLLNFNLGHWKEMQDLIENHEFIVGKRIQKMPISKYLSNNLSLEFKNMGFFAKSLGAWGGDFFMVGVKSSMDSIIEELRNLGYDTFFDWNSIVNI